MTSRTCGMASEYGLRRSVSTSVLVPSVSYTYGRTAPNLFTLHRDPHWHGFEPEIGKRYDEYRPINRTSRTTELWDDYWMNRKWAYKRYFHYDSPYSYWWFYPSSYYYPPHQTHRYTNSYYWRRRKDPNYVHLSNEFWWP